MNIKDLVLKKLVFCLFVFPLFAIDPWYFEVKPCYYYLTNSTLSEIFNNGGGSFRAETGYFFHKNGAVWLDGGYFGKIGQSINGPYSTKITLGTLSVGLKGFYWPTTCFALYAGGAPRFYFLSFHNDSPYVEPNNTRNFVGGAFTAGIWIVPVRHFLIDVFADYSIGKANFSPSNQSSYTYDTSIDGLSIGGGLGITF